MNLSPSYAPYVKPLRLQFVEPRGFWYRACAIRTILPVYFFAERRE